MMSRHLLETSKSKTPPSDASRSLSLSHPDSEISKVQYISLSNQLGWVPVPQPQQNAGRGAGGGTPKPTRSPEPATSPRASTSRQPRCTSDQLQPANLASSFHPGAVPPSVPLSRRPFLCQSAWAHARSTDFGLLQRTWKNLGDASFLFSFPG